MLEKEDVARQMLTRKGKQRLAADMVEVQARQDFIIVTVEIVRSNQWIYVGHSRIRSRNPSTPSIVST